MIIALEKLYSFLCCEMPSLEWQDMAYHIKYIENNEWKDARFRDSARANQFYLEKRKQLENFYLSNKIKHK